MKEDEEIGEGSLAFTFIIKIKHTIHVADILCDYGKTERDTICVIFHDYSKGKLPVCSSNSVWMSAEIVSSVFGGLQEYEDKYNF